MTTTPEALRDAGIAAAENATDPRWIIIVDSIIETAATTGNRFSADDIREHVPITALHLVGGRIRSFLMRKEIVMVGEVRSTWPATHHKKIGVYVGADHDEVVAS